jgi:hypothetical protein
MTSTADYTTEEREIYAIEYRQCGMRTHTKCAEQARDTIDRARKAFVGTVHGHGCSGGSTAKQRAGYTHLQAIPSNAMELAEITIAAACAWANLPVADFYRHLGCKARQWALVALSNAPAADRGVRDQLGPGRASDILRTSKPGACHMAGSLQEKFPLAYDAAIRFGQALRLEWES